MKEMESFLQIVTNGLKSVAQGFEAMAEMIDAMSKAQPENKSTPNTKTKPGDDKPLKPKKQMVDKEIKKKQQTATDTVFNIISKSNEGIDSLTLMEQTGYNSKKIQNIIYKLKVKKKIKNKSRGIYIKA